MPKDTTPLLIDGAQGEGGGQILRSAVSLAALLGRDVRLERIRAGRARPGLAAQHLTSVKAAAELCQAELEGAALGSLALAFRPRRAVRPGRYVFNVADARKGGSAGATSLVLQTTLLPLALAGGGELAVLGGTHVPMSPPYDFLERVFLPALARLGLEASLDLRRAGFYPQGGGRLKATVAPLARLRPLKLLDPGPLSGVSGRVSTAQLPAHVAQRMVATAERELAPLGVPVAIDVVEVEARSPGVAVFLQPGYAAGLGGFSAVGQKGRPAEQVAEEACRTLLAHHRSCSAVDVRLADQLLLPLAFASGPSRFTTDRLSGHLATNAQVVEQFGAAAVAIVDQGPKVLVIVTPR